ncbi:hypothetical protein [Streptomyces lydicus]|uniref:hypothetical protein n=1 Tax=Streptomyces lydicus TaxID=47763 RepID=UPI0036E9B870
MPVRHPWRWAAVAVTAVLIARFVHGPVTNPASVQLLFWFNLAYLDKRLDFGIPFGPGFFHLDTMGLVGAMGAAVLGLALHQAAYAAVRVVPLPMAVTAWYVLLTTVLSVLQHYVERHFSKGATR